MCSCVLQIVVTDIEECMEALAENLSNNLPHGTMSHVNVKQEDISGGGKAPPDGWDVPQSVIDTAVQELPSKLHIGSRIPAGVSTENVRPPSESGEATSIDSEAQKREESPTELSTGSQEAKDGEKWLAGRTRSSNGMCQTKVIARMLDWTGEVQSLQPPFDALLVADVVSYLFTKVCCTKYFGSCSPSQTSRMPMPCCWRKIS